MINESMMEKTLSILKTMVDGNTVIGTPIDIKTATVIQISKISVGMVNGGGEYGKKEDYLYPNAGIGGVGASLLPIGFLYISERERKFISTEKGEEGKWKDLINATLNLLSSK